MAGVALIGWMDYPGIAFGMTVGIACFRTPSGTAEDLLRGADEAMYRGKSTDKGSVVVQNV